VETTDAWGSVEAEYRSYFNDDAKEVHDGLESYMKNTYLADKLTKLDSTKVSDFSVPFRIRLETDTAKRGASESADAVVAILFSGLTTRLPDYFTSEGDNKDKKPTAPPRTDDFVLPEPYVDEWHYHIVPSPGFAANPLPAAREQQIGPANLTAEFRKNADGTVDATIRFDTGKRRMTAQQADALRTGIIALNKENAVMITFNEIGEADLAAGKVSEALTQFRALVTMHPKEALHHDQIARAVLAGGMGELAREEAKKASELEPSSAEVYTQLGLVLEDDLVGRQFKKGFDLNGAIAAFQKAVELDPKNSRIRGNYAILLEHNKQGVRYGPGARLNDAIDQYRAVGDDLAGLGLGNNLPVALVWAKRFPELKQEAERAPPSAAREAQLLIARAAMDGSAVAIAQAAADEPDSNTQRTVLVGAGGLLMELRIYPQAADLLEAGAKGNQNAASLLAEAALVRNMKPHEDAAFTESDPRSIAAKFLIEDRGAAKSVDDISSLFTTAAGQYFADPNSIAFWSNAPATFRMQMAEVPFPLDAALDIDLAGAQYAVEGSDVLGYRITCSGPSTVGTAVKTTLFVVKENGKYKIVGMTGLMSAVLGDQIVRFVDGGNLAAAAQWLDWVRDGADAIAADDSLATDPTVRMWKKGQGQDKDAIRYAAAALMAEGRVFAPGAVPILLEGLAKATSDEQRLSLDKALADAYQVEGDFANELPVARRLTKEAPDSKIAAERLETALGQNKGWDESIQFAEDRMNKNSGEPWEIRDYAWALWQAGRLDEAQTARKKLIDSGKATAFDYNQIAWGYLMENKVTPEAVQEAEHATLMSDGRDGAIVDTQAAIYAEIGRASEAYTMELQAIDLDGDEEPNDSSWYVFGRIAEQYGERGAAIEDYKKCKAPDNPLALSDSAYALAQRRLNALEQTAK
jgi:tetratricopeptide (TPR) repeat protein